ncbi:MAG: hypothetical protein WDO15_22145 [Bacteroidota bacterium]
MYDKAARQIERIDEYKTRNNSLNTIQIERTFFEVSRKIDALCEELESFKKVLFDDIECGRSVKEMYLTSDISQANIELKQDLSHFKWNEVEPFPKETEIIRPLSAEVHAGRLSLARSKIILRLYYQRP